MTWARHREALEAEARTFLMDETMNASCQHCDWTATGQAQEVIGAQKIHRTTHGIVVQTKRRPLSSVSSEKGRKT